MAFTAACARDICRSVRSRRQLDRPGVVAGRRNITSVAASEARKMPTPRRRACCHFHLPSAVIRIEPCLLTKEFLPNNDMARSACRVSVSSREPTASTARQLRLRHSTAHVKQDDRPAVNKGRAHSEPPILQHHVIWCQGRLRCSIPSRRVKFRKVWRHPRRPPYERATSSARTLPGASTFLCTSRAGSGRRHLRLCRGVPDSLGASWIGSPGAGTGSCGAVDLRALWNLGSCHASSRTKNSRATLPCLCRGFVRSLFRQRVPLMS